MEQENYKKLATTLIKLEMVKAGIGYGELVERLAKIGVEETVSGVTQKILRGTYPAAFLIQFCKALGIDTIKLDI